MKGNADLVQDEAAAAALFHDTSHNPERPNSVAPFDDTPSVTVQSNPQRSLSPRQKALIAANFRGMNEKMDSELSSLKDSLQSFRRELTVVRYQTSAIIARNNRVKKAITDLEDQIHDDIFPHFGRLDKDRDQVIDTIGVDSQ